MPTATMTSKGQITVPAAVRAALHLEPGTRVRFVELEGGGFEMRPASRPASSLKGFFGPPPEVPVTIEEMNDAIADGASESGR